MVAVTQLIPNFLGGVSRQTDDKKLDGQVVDIINGFPDPTYGLTKRQSTYFNWNLKRPVSEREFEEDELKNAFWFNALTKIQVTELNQAEYPPPRFSIGDVVETPYLCAISGGQIYVWDAYTGEPQIVFNSGTEYLRRPDGTFYDENDFHHRTILDTTIICNRNIIPEMVENTTEFTPGLVGTIRLNAVLPEETYTAIIDGTPYSYTSPGEVTPDQILNGLGSAIPAQFNPTVYKTSIELESDTPFKLEVKDSQNNALLNSYQDTILNQALLANPSREGRLVEVVGDNNSAADNYYLVFKGTIWEETVNPTVDVEIVATTMPHRLYINNQGTWQFGPIDYVDRLVGDDESNPVPTFIGTPINASFYYNNRLGFLSGANVIMSQAKDVYNFFAESQLTTTDADPIDLNANSTRPVELFEVVTQPQGVLLFGTRQQFWLAALESGVLTPTGSSIQTISSYEADKKISPLDIGTTIGFVSKTPDYSKLMIMQGQGSQIDPVVVEISKVVTGWLPNTINRMAVSPQNSFVVLTGKDDDYLYIYRFYNDGQEDQMQAWCKWKMLGPVQALQVVNDMIAMVTMNGGRYSVSMMSLNSLDKSGMQLSDDPMKPGAPYLDFLTRPESTVYDAETGETKFYVPFPLLPEKQGQMVLTLPGMIIPSPASYIDLFENRIQLPRGTEDDPGYWVSCTQGTDDTGDYFSAKGDFTEYTEGISIGYQYEYEVTLPKFYYKLGGQANRGDYTAPLTINRLRVAIGLSGAITFKLKARGSDEWVDIQHVTDADYYEADLDPVVAESQLTVPINQRNKNFQIKITSDVPFPVSLVSMMWEGQYTPRFYRRA